MAQDQNRFGVLFDIDGTLVDDNYLHVVAWWQGFRQHGHDVPMVEIHRRIGMGSTRLVNDLIGRDDERVVNSHSNFYAPFRENLVPFDGARDLLRDCADHGYVVVLVTSADPEEIESLTAAIDAKDAVSTVTGAEDAEAAKPEPDLLHAAMDKAGLRAENCVMVGDTVWDVEAAERAGVPCVAVLSGGIPRADLEEAGAVAVYADVAALRADLPDSPIGRLANSRSGTA